MSGRLLRIEKWETLARQADFQPAKMAALCPVSLRQLERFFALRFGKTPGEWGRELKCRQALKLIIEGYSNKAVVAELKFASGSHFCHEFKKIYGNSPQSFSCRGENVAFKQSFKLAQNPCAIEVGSLNEGLW